MKTLHTLTNLTTGSIEHSKDGMIRSDATPHESSTTSSVPFRKKTIRIKLHRPSNIEEIYALFNNSKPQRRLIDFILSGIRQHQLLKLADNNCNEYFEFSWNTARAIAGNKKYFTPVKKLLKENSIVIEAPFNNMDGTYRYSVGDHPIRYEFGELLTNVEWTLDEHATEFNLPVHSDENIIEHSTLTFDEELLEKVILQRGTPTHLVPLVKQSFMNRLTCGKNTYNICSTGRAYGAWSNLPRAYRGALLIDNKPVIEIDIKACQPTLLHLLYPCACKESERYRGFIRNDIYDMFVQAYHKLAPEAPQTQRKAIKDMFVQFLGGKQKDESVTPVRMVFQRYFPQLLKIIEELNKPNHRNLIRFLQGQESSMIVEDVCKNYPVYSMHDAVICPIEIKDEVKKNIEDVVLAKLGFEVKVEFDDKRKTLL